MENKMVCPLSMVGDNIKACHIDCKLNNNGKCLLAEYLKKQTHN